MNTPGQAEQWKIVGRSDNEALCIVAELIDYALDHTSSWHTDHAFALLEELSGRGLADTDAALLHYFRANAWECKRHENGEYQAWSWEQLATQKQLLELRKCVLHSGFSGLHPIRRCQIYTNLGSQMNFIGRFVEAIAYWDRDLAVQPNFAMAQGNKALGLKYYAMSLYDGGHANLHLLFAYDTLSQALSDEAIYESEVGDQEHEKFAAIRAEIETLADISIIRENVKLEDYELGETADERAYRTWCLEQNLFLNPLNDLGAFPIAAQDIFTLPSVRTKGDARMPEIIGLYNQMKQEFVTARYLFYQGWEQRSLLDTMHFSDKGVLLYNTLDYPTYGLATEQMRISYRMTYSLFDKCAYFLNTYFDVGHAFKQVNFRNVWYCKKGKQQKLAQIFQESKNWPLRGLFWLSKDFFDPDFQETTAPEAQALSDLRHHIEHKYLHLTEFDSRSGSKSDDGNHTTIRYALSLTAFSERCLHLLSMARAAMIYLSLAVHVEERRRQSEDGESVNVASMPLDKWDDAWKI